MTQKQTTRKAKRKLSDIDFAGDKAHLALVCPEIGGPANGMDKALVIKSAGNFSEEFLEKASQIKVTMDIEDFLCRFFGLWSEDAEMLVRLFGFEPKATYLQDEAMEYDQYMQEKLSNYEILKSANGALQEGNLAKYLAGLNEEQYLMLLQDQELIEKALDKESAVKAADASTDTNLVENTEVEVSKATSVKNDNTTEQSMQEVKTETVEKSVEMVEKAALVELQKALDAQKEELQKAKDTIEQFKQAEKERIAKARKEQVEAAVGDKVQAEVIAKAALLVEDEAEFQEVLKALSAVAEKAKAAADELFVEKGASAEVKEEEQPNLVAAILKAKTK